MIDQIYIEGVPVLTFDSSGFIGLKGHKGLGGPSVDMSSYSRGGRSGVALATPYYRNFGFSLEFIVRGYTFAQFIQKRDLLMRLFSHVEDKDLDQFKTIEFELADGSLRSAEILIGQAVSDLGPENKLHALYMIPFETELEYFKGPTMSKTITIYNAGGMAVPMATPMDMTNDATTATGELTNSGNAPSYPTCRVYGPMTSFSLQNITTGKTLSCAEALATAADYIDFDFYFQTAVKNGTINVLDQISGSWWNLAVGANQVKLASASTSTVANAQFNYHSAYRNV